MVDMSQLNLPRTGCRPPQSPLQLQSANVPSTVGRIQGILPIAFQAPEATGARNFPGRGRRLLTTIACFMPDLTAGSTS